VLFCWFIIIIIARVKVLSSSGCCDAQLATLDNITHMFAYID
jgi:hypothetical protein